MWKAPLGGTGLQQWAGWGQRGINKCSWGVQDGSCSRADSICQRCCLVMCLGGCRPPGGPLSITLFRVKLEVLHDLTQSLFVLDDPKWGMSPENRVTNICDHLKVILGENRDFCSWELEQGGGNSDSHSCLISWIFSWQSSSSGWSWACCLASCSLAVCLEGTFEKIYANHLSVEDEEKTEDEL